VQKPKDITKDGIAGECPVCSEVVDVFLDILGAEAGSMALRGMTTGGVYIAGGIPVRLMDRIEKGGLKNAYLNPASRFSKVTSRFPLYVLNKEVGLQGVFNFAMSLAKRSMGPLSTNTPSNIGIHSVSSSASSSSTKLA
jgi:glucokinase